MTAKQIAFRLEELQIKVWSLSSITLAVRDAMIEGSGAASNYHGALHALTDMTYELEHEMRGLVDKLFQDIKKEG